MRRILLALTVLAFTVPAAEAARRDDTRQQASRPAAQAAQPKAQASTRPQTRPARSAATRPSTSSVPARPGDVRTSSRGLVVRGAAAATGSRDAMASCTRRNGRTVCGQARQAVSRDSVRGWQVGLLPADNAQRECPEGTFATLARGHDDVVRCMPM